MGSWLNLFLIESRCCLGLDSKALEDGGREFIFCLQSAVYNFPELKNLFLLNTVSCQHRIGVCPWNKALY